VPSPTSSLPLVHQRARLGVEVGIRVGDGNRLSEQLEGTASFTSSLADHGEQIDTFDLVWKLAHELMAKALGLVVAICEEEVEGTVCEAIFGTASTVAGRAASRPRLRSYSPSVVADCADTSCHA